MCFTKGIDETDPAKMISDAALGKGHPPCVEALDLFVSTLGVVSGDLESAGMGAGGVYLGRGILA